MLDHMREEKFVNAVVFKRHGNLRAALKIVHNIDPPQGRIVQIDPFRKYVAATPDIQLFWQILHSSSAERRIAARNLRLPMVFISAASKSA